MVNNVLAQLIAVAILGLIAKGWSVFASWKSNSAMARLTPKITPSKNIALTSTPGDEELALLEARIFAMEVFMLQRAIGVYGIGVLAGALLFVFELWALNRQLLEESQITRIDVFSISLNAVILFACLIIIGNGIFNCIYSAAELRRKQAEV